MKTKRAKTSRRANRGASVLSITEAKSRHEGALMKISGVEGVALGECGGRPAIVVYVVRRSPKLVSHIPQTLEGFPVTIEVSGGFSAQERG
jgi:hypothetical protein